MQEVRQPFRFLPGLRHTHCTALSRNVYWDDGLATLVADALLGVSSRRITDEHRVVNDALEIVQLRSTTDSRHLTRSIRCFTIGPIWRA